MAKSHAKKHPSSDSFAEEAKTIAKKERDIQREIDRSDKKQKGGAGRSAKVNTFAAREKPRPRVDPCDRGFPTKAVKSQGTTHRK